MTRVCLAASVIAAAVIPGPAGLVAFLTLWGAAMALIWARSPNFAQAGRR